MTDLTTTPEALVEDVLRKTAHGIYPDAKSHMQEMFAASPALRDAIALGVAWAAVETVLPEGWWMHQLIAYSSGERSWYAEAAGYGVHLGVYGPTKEAALLALHAALLAREETRP
jgi:hypothetical protein